MYDTIYVEREIVDEPRVENILGRFPKAITIPCDRYSEVFNRKSQDFRLQKMNPSLILAHKKRGFVLPAPPEYGLGSPHNYYFSTMMNCVYDCRYCFLQGMYRSAHHVLFVNYEDFATEITRTAQSHNDSDVWFFSGYDCDSLAMEPFAAMAEYFVNLAENQPNVWLELRTKSTQVRFLLNHVPVDNVVVAFSLTPQKISSQLEHKVPSLQKRINASRELQAAGWKIGFRIDPLIFTSDYRDQYRELFRDLYSNVNMDLLHSVTVGGFRMPQDFFRSMERLYPDDKFVAQPFEQVNGMVSYPREQEEEMIHWCRSELSQYMDEDKVHLATIAI